MAHKTLITVTLVAIFLLSFQQPLYSGVYKWIDENGQIHYSDQPDNPDAEKFTLRKNTTTEARPANSDDQDAEDAAEEESTKPAEPKMVEVEPSKKEKRKLCNEAKRDIEAILSRGRMREVNKKGEYIYIPEEQRQKRLSAARKKQREYCR